MERIVSDDSGQIHAMEAVIAALLFFGALQVGVSLIPDSQSTTALDTLSITGEDALRTLFYLKPVMGNSSDPNSTGGANDPALYQNSSLVFYIVTGMTSNVTDFLNSTLDSSISYSLGYRILPQGNFTMLFEMVQTVDESLSSHFSFFHEGILYDVRLILWKEPRGGIA